MFLQWYILDRYKSAFRGENWTFRSIYKYTSPLRHVGSNDRQWTEKFNTIWVTSTNSFKISLTLSLNQKFQPVNSSWMESAHKHEGKVFFKVLIIKLGAIDEIGLWNRRRELVDSHFHLFPWNDKCLKWILFNCAVERGKTNGIFRLFR